jgi:glycine oxidase
VEWLEGDEARRLEPALSPEVRAGLFSVREHQVDSARLTRAAWLAAARAGVHFHTGEVVGITTARGRVRGVTLVGGEELVADRVVVAAGCWSAQLTGLPRPLPVAPVRGQIVVLESCPPLLTRMVGTSRCYLVPRSDGRLVIGATMEAAGFESRTTGAGVHRLLGAALAAVPELAEAEVVELRAGLRPGTPDELPILGSDPMLEGLYHATGHFRNGILLAPITALLLAEAITAAETSIPLAPFAPERFAAAERPEVREGDAAREALV